MNKKQLVLAELFEICRDRDDFIFDNELVKQVAAKHGFKNPFDATKLDSQLRLPDTLIANDFAVIHLGNGRHQFVKGLVNVYHTFEPIQEVRDWPYKKSLLNEFNTSESNVLSVANNQRILHDFVFGGDKEFDADEISLRAKTYFPHRTKTNLEYNIGKNNPISLTNIQIEIDLTIEYRGIISIFEAKNRQSKNFSVYQIYHPFLYYYNARERIGAGNDLKEVVCAYVVRSYSRGNTVLSLWLYEFSDPLDITSIKLRKATEYHLLKS